jgi:hypothetical protein
MSAPGWIGRRSSQARACANDQNRAAGWYGSVACSGAARNMPPGASTLAYAAVKSYFDANGVVDLNRARLVETAGLPLEADRMLEYALIWASSHNRSEVVAFLLDKEPDLTFREPLFDSTALGVARYRGNREMVALLGPLTPRQSP